MQTRPRRRHILHRILRHCVGGGLYRVSSFSHRQIVYEMMDDNVNVRASPGFLDLYPDASPDKLVMTCPHARVG
jgi:hypothetical protein